MKDYDAWLFDHPDDHGGDEHLKDQEIIRIMGEHNLDWDDAEAYFTDMLEKAERDQAEERALDMLECGRD